MTNKRKFTVYLNDNEMNTVEELVKKYRASGYSHLVRLMLQDVYAMFSDKEFDRKENIISAKVER